MISVKSDDVWKELEHLYENTTNIKAAVAYVTDQSVIAFGEGDIVVVDIGARVRSCVLP